VDGSLTGYENLLIFAKLYDLPHRDQQARIREALDFMGLTADGGRLVGEYSGGMVRRLEIAQSTLHRPRVLFLDEPTVGLDPIARDAVWKHLVDLRTNYGTTLFFTTHYLEEAQSYCDRIAIMHLGKLDARWLSHGFPESANALADSLARFRELLRAKYEQSNSENNQQMHRLKQTIKHRSSFKFTVASYVSAQFVRRMAPGLTRFPGLRHLTDRTDIWFHPVEFQSPIPLCL
jgi:ABC-type multidrug transport system ATPase subunit